MVGFLSLILQQLVLLIAPTLGLAVLLHGLERWRSRLATVRWGWRSVLVTAWVGAPLHELAHAALHRLSGHTIETLKLFDPDPETGCLGYVAYRFNPRAPRQRIGRFFAGVAPLFAGVGAVWLLAAVLVEDSGRWFPTGASARAMARADDPFEATLALGRIARLTVGALTDPEHLRSLRFWVFLYLSTAVVAHMGPSRSDLRGGRDGALACLALVFAANLAAALFGLSPGAHLRAMVTAYAPLVGVLAFAVVLSLVLVALTALGSLVTAAVRARRVPDPSLPDVADALKALGVSCAALVLLLALVPGRAAPRRGRRAALARPATVTLYAKVTDAALAL